MPGPSFPPSMLTRPSSTQESAESKVLDSSSDSSEDDNEDEYYETPMRKPSRKTSPRTRSCRMTIPQPSKHMHPDWDVPRAEPMTLTATNCSAYPAVTLAHQCHRECRCSRVRSSTVVAATASEPATMHCTLLDYGRNLPRRCL